MPFSHFVFYVPTSKLEDLVTFLLASFGHLGFKEHHRPIPTVVGMGDERPFFWIGGQDMTDDEIASEKLKKPHIALAATSKEQVDEFHAAALKAGGTCNGPPGPRPHYGPDYYGAFVLDPAVGINFEVVYL